MQQDHDGSGKRKRKGRGQNAWPVDFPAEAFRKGVHAGDFVGSEAAKQPDGMSEHGIARAGGFSQWSKEEEVGRRAQRGEHEGIACQQSQQGQQGYSDKAVERDVGRPDERRRQVSQQPIEAKPVDEQEDVFCPMVRRRTHRTLHRYRHFCLDVREQVEVLIIFIDPAFPLA